MLEAVEAFGAPQSFAREIRERERGERWRKGKASRRLLDGKNLL